MLPVNLLGDAAAAETMVQQATRSQRSDQLARNDIFDRYLYLNREITRLNSVRPTEETPSKSRIEEEYPDENLQEENRKRRQQPFSFQNADQPPIMHEELQPTLFDIHTDRVVSSYHHTDEVPKIGIQIDRKV